MPVFLMESLRERTVLKSFLAQASWISAIFSSKLSDCCLYNSVSGGEKKGAGFLGGFFSAAPAPNGRPRPAIPKKPMPKNFLRFIGSQTSESTPLPEVLGGGGLSLLFCRSPDIWEGWFFFNLLINEKYLI